MFYLYNIIFYLDLANSF